GKWLEQASRWHERLPAAGAEAQAKLWDDGLAIWQGVLAQFGTAAATGGEAPAPRADDKRFADPRWREHPFFALVHRTYLLLAEQVTALAGSTGRVGTPQAEQLQFMLT